MNKFKLTLLSLFLPIAVGAQETITIHDDHLDEDEVIELPEGMTATEDSLIKEWHARNYLFPDTAFIDDGTIPAFSPDVYQDRLRRLPCVMEMPYNNVVQKFIDQYTGRLRRSVSIMLAAGNFYVPIFEEALDRYGLPLELKYLPFIESALDPTAVSRAGATGLWQFMLSTGQRYGLKVNSLVDERRDPIKATDAAVRYLKDLYDIYGDWSLVIAAYNCGPGKVNRAINRADGSRDYWEIYPYLPAETRGYVPAFIAANYVMNYYCEHNIRPLKARMPVSTDTIMVSRDVHFQQIADLCHIDIDAIKALNPQYRTNVIPGYWQQSSLCLPNEMLNTFVSYKDSIYNHRADELFKRRSVVQVSEASEQPRYSQPSRSQKASRGKKASRHERASRSRRGRGGRGSTATVRKGDTLSDIARRNGTTVNALKKKNRIKGNTIRPGQKIKVK